MVLEVQYLVIQKQTLLILHVTGELAELLKKNESRNLFQTGAH